MFFGLKEHSFGVLFIYIIYTLHYIITLLIYLTFLFYHGTLLLMFPSSLVQQPILHKIKRVGRTWMLNGWTCKGLCVCVCICVCECRHIYVWEYRRAGGQLKCCVCEG